MYYDIFLISKNMFQAFEEYVLGGRIHIYNIRYENNSMMYLYIYMYTLHPPEGDKNEGGESHQVGCARWVAQGWSPGVGRPGWVAWGGSPGVGRLGGSPWAGRSGRVARAGRWRPTLEQTNRDRQTNRQTDGEIPNPDPPPQRAQE